MLLIGNMGVEYEGTLHHLCNFSLNIKHKVLLFVCFKVTAVGNALPGLINSKMSLGSAGEVGRASSSAVQISACWWLTPSVLIIQWARVCVQDLGRAVVSPAHPLSLLRAEAGARVCPLTWRREG